VRALAGREGPGVTEALLARLTDEYPSVQNAAAEVLADREDPAVTAALLARLIDENPGVRESAVKALAGREGPGVTEALTACLTGQDIVRFGAGYALAGRENPGLTKALLARLTDQDSAVRCAAVTALAGREDPGVATAVGARLTDQDSAVQQAAVKALADGKSPQALLSLANGVQALSRSLLPEVTRTAEQLMIRHYLQVDPEEREEVRAEMAWLATTAWSSAQTLAAPTERSEHDPISHDPGQAHPSRPTRDITELQRRRGESATTATGDHKTRSGARREPACGSGAARRRTCA
jgi:HEAT repeats